MLLLSLYLLFNGLTANSVLAGRTCKATAGSPGWPLPLEWDAFNATLGGVLLKPESPAARCYDASDPDNLQVCAQVRARWNSSQWHSDNPISSLWQNINDYSCMPNGQSCNEHGYPIYVVAAKRVEHVKAAVSFARTKNLRLNIKSTGHDFLGRSTQPRSLSIWTHHLDSMQWHENSFQLQSCNTSIEGNFVTAGSGTQMNELYESSTARKLMIVGGNSETVSVGGYLLGGGHSVLSPLLGMGADQIVQIEAVTADGQSVIANECTNPDLFWAMRGGGGSTHAVATSFTIRAFPTVPLALYYGNIVGTYAVSANWHAVTHVHREWATRLAPIAASGYLIGNPNNLTGKTTIQIIVPNKSVAELQTIVDPILQEVRNITAGAVNVTGKYYRAPTYGDFLYPNRTSKRDQTTLFPGNGGTKLITSWLWGAETLAQPFETVKTALRESVDAEASTLLYSDFTAGPGTANPPFLRPGGNAINPAWRKAIVRPATEIQYYSSSKSLLANREAALKRFGQSLRSVAEGMGAYGNEADVRTEDFGRAFWGAGYERLVGVKRQYDPDDVFWCKACVGSEAWVESEDGMLCKKDASG